MRIPDAMVQQLLLEAKKTTTDQIDELAKLGKQQNKPLQDMVIEKQVINEAELAQLYSKEIDVSFIDLSELKIDKEILKQIPERIAKEYRAVLFEVKGDTKKLALADPDDLQAIDFLTKQLGGNIEIYLATNKDVSVALDDYKGSLSSELSSVVTGEGDEEEAVKEAVKEEDLAEDSPIAQTVNLIIEYAIKAKASDIHIEPREQFVQVRYRVDGVLREANKLPRKVMAALVSRIKILANLKIDEHRAPQDGRFKISLGEAIYAMRVSTLPVVDGEKVVMRILDETTQALSLEELGFWGVSLKNIHDAISQPHGIMLVTGPTGSGKSTTLFSVLNLLNNPGVNISTIEDPVEYRIPGVNQTQVNVKAGMTFAGGLRALLRQDPNVIMIGEIRDGETADLAIQAALTGHLVFATLHTNNAATAIPRLLDMGAEPFLIASTVRAVIGQRLVRRLSPEARESYHPTQAELKDIKDNFEIKEAIAQVKQAEKIKIDKEELEKESKKVIKPVNADVKDKSIMDKIKEDPNILDRSAAEAVAEKAVKEAVKKQEEKESKPNDTKDDDEAEKIQTSESKLTLWRVKEGAEGTGYKGRVGIYEVLSISQKVQQLISARATADEIQDQAIKEGMMTMQQDGFVKAMQGRTTVEEILRVTRE